MIEAILLAINQALIPHQTWPCAQTWVNKKREVVGPIAFKERLKSASMGMRQGVRDRRGNPSGICVMCSAEGTKKIKNKNKQAKRKCTM